MRLRARGGAAPGPAKGQRPLDPFQTARTIARHTLLVLTLALVAGCAAHPSMPAIDQAPSTAVGAIYKATASTLVDGDFDVLHTDVSHNLLVSGSLTTAGTFPPGPAPTASLPTPFTTTNSNGATAVTLVSLTAAKVIIPWHLTIDNEDTVTHTVDLLTSSGTSIDHFQLLPQGAWTYDGNASGFSVRTLSGEGLQFKIDAGGSGTSCKAIGYASKQ